MLYLEDDREGCATKKNYVVLATFVSRDLSSHLFIESTRVRVILVLSRVELEAISFRVRVSFESLAPPTMHTS